MTGSEKYQHVFFAEGDEKLSRGWYFTDITGHVGGGPYDTEEAAWQGFQHYAKYEKSPEQP